MRAFHRLFAGVLSSVLSSLWPSRTAVAIAGALSALAPSAHSRWAEVSEAAYAVNHENSRFKIRKDGTYSLQTERQIEILKESARTDRGLHRITFDARASRFRLIEAKTINSGRAVKVERRHIEVKPLASTGQGFDEIRQATIAYPDVMVGSKLRSKHARDVTEPPIPGYFGMLIAFGANELLQKSEIEFSSEIPLFFEAFDPEGFLELEAGRQGGRWRVRARLKRPLFRMIVEESNVVFDAKSVPWLGVSTAKDWSSFPRGVAEAYERQMDAPLSAPHAAILEAAKAKSGDVERIDEVTSRLQAAFRYVGDWAPVKGAFFPRSSAEVAKTGFGDCKDFATSAAAILRRLGFESRVAWVARGRSVPLSPLGLATPDFNHAIAYVAKDGREWWIDPTNLNAYAKAIYSDIADRPALLLDPKGSRLKRTPPMKPGEGESKMEVRLAFRADGEIEATGEIALLGRGVLPMTAVGLSYSRQQIDYMLISWIANVGNLSSWSFDRADFAERIARDYRSGFEYRERWRPTQTSAGVGYMIPVAPVASILDFRRDRRVGGVELHDPGAWRRTHRFVAKRASLRRPLECSGQSEWLDYSRRFERDRANGEIVAIDETLTKKAAITAAETKSAAFAELQDGVGACLREAVVIFAD